MNIMLEDVKYEYFALIDNSKRINRKKKPLLLKQLYLWVNNVSQDEYYVTSYGRRPPLDSNT